MTYFLKAMFSFKSQLDSIRSFNFAFIPTLITTIFLAVLSVIFFIVLAFGDPFDFKSVANSDQITKVRLNKMLKVKIIFFPNKKNQTVIQASSLINNKEESFNFFLRDINSYLIINNKKINIHSSTGNIDLGNNEIRFKENVKIDYLDNSYIKSDLMVYYINEQKIAISGLLLKTNNNFQVNSKSLILDGKNNTIKSKDKTIINFNTQ